jgi:hypothetical protein
MARHSWGDHEDPIMTSCRIITLFTAAATPPRNGISPLTISLLAHGIAICILSLGLRHTARIYDRPIREQSSVRLLEVRSSSLRRSLSYHEDGWNPASRAPADSLQTRQRFATQSSLALQVPQVNRALQTLLQPDLPPNVVVSLATPIPSVLLWSPSNRQVKRLVPPPDHEATKAEATPSLAPPNHELRFADVGLSPTDFGNAALAPPPGTTTPVVVSGPQIASRVPEMTTNSASPPTAARVISRSALDMWEGEIALPPVNQTAPLSDLAAAGGEEERTVKRAGAGIAANRSQGGDAPDGADRFDKNGGSDQMSGSSHGPAQIPGVRYGPGSNDNTSIHGIRLPKDGRFGVVVVGSSVTDQYPETFGIWGGRLAYTVYVHAGLSKNWILQYSLPSSADAAAAGSNVRPEAPWPFYIAVPHVGVSGLDTDAIMIHGMVNTAGRFEQLAIVFPAEFAQKDFVLGAMQEWQFRPAMQNGQVITVEVLLIIPSEYAHDGDR